MASTPKHILEAVLVAFLLLSFSAKAQEISANIGLPKDHITMGEELPVTLKLEYPQAYKPLIPRALPLPQGIELQGLNIQDSSLHDGQVSYSLTYHYLALDTGTFSLPAIEVHFTKDAANTVSISTEPRSFEVRLMAVDTAKDIKPIVGPLAVAGKKSFPWEYVAAGILSVVLLTLLFLLLRKKGPAPEPRPVVYKTPYTVASEALQKLEEEKPWLNAGGVKEYYVRLSYTLRRYLSDVFGTDTLELTTDQTVEAMRHQALDSERLDNMERILNMADLVKFARYSPDTEENQSMLRETARLVDEINVAEHMRRAAEAKASEGQNE